LHQLPTNTFLRVLNGKRLSVTEKSLSFVHHSKSSCVVWRHLEDIYFLSKGSLPMTSRTKDLSKDVSTLHAPRSKVCVHCKVRSTFVPSSPWNLRLSLNVYSYKVKSYGTSQTMLFFSLFDYLSVPIGQSLVLI